MIKLQNKSECTGCTACKSICPQKCIEMVEDEEGFLYPKVDKEKCINCGLCEKVCPVKNAKVEKKEQKGYVLNNNDDEVRKKSTSGGAFTPIAEYVLKRNGICFGATFDQNFKVIHRAIDRIEDIDILRGSKYVQSDLNDCFEKAKKFLDDNKYVCFSGTPCQIEGLKKFLIKDYEKLITVDVMCHAVPSPLVWQKYISYIKKCKLNNKNIKQVLFRDKSKYGFKYSTMTIKSENEEYSRGVETDPYLRAFFGDLSDRPSCYNCAFKKQFHESDFTIWDCFIAENFDKKLDDDKGTSRILVNSEKGEKIFEEIKYNFNYTEVNVDDLVKNVKEMSHSVAIPEKREQFFKDINQIKEEDFFSKYFPDSLKVKCERNIRIMLARTGIYKKVKSIVKRILRK